MEKNCFWYNCFVRIYLDPKSTTLDLVIFTDSSMVNHHEKPTKSKTVGGGIS